MTNREKVREIARLLDEAYDHLFEHGDAACKSSEGVITLHSDTYFDRKGKPPRFSRVEVYSYCLGPSRSHSFRSVDEALETVREWHETEMFYDYDADDEEAW